MTNFYFPKIQKKTKNKKKNNNQKIKDHLIGFATDVIIWIILLEYFVIFAVCPGMKTNIITQVWEIVHNINYINRIINM